MLVGMLVMTLWMCGIGGRAGKEEWELVWDTLIVCYLRYAKKIDHLQYCMKHVLKANLWKCDSGSFSCVGCT